MLHRRKFYFEIKSFERTNSRLKFSTEQIERFERTSRNQFFLNNQEFLAEQTCDELFEAENHFLLNFERTVDDDYLPTAADILNVRVPTTGANFYFLLNIFLFEKMSKLKN